MHDPARSPAALPRPRILVIVAAVAAVALGLFAALGLGAGESDWSSPPSDFEVVPGPVVEHPGKRIGAAGAPAGAQISAARASKRKSIKLRYSNSSFFTLDGGAADKFFMSCGGSGWRIINGYLGTKSPGAVLSNSDPSGNARKWFFGLINLNDTEAVEYYTGVVCVKGFK